MWRWGVQGQGGGASTALGLISESQQGLCDKGWNAEEFQFQPHRSYLLWRCTSALPHVIITPVAASEQSPPRQLNGGVERQGMPL